MLALKADERVLLRITSLRRATLRARLQVGQGAVVALGTPF